MIPLGNAGRGPWAGKSNPSQIGKCNIMQQGDGRGGAGMEGEDNMHRYAPYRFLLGPKT